MFKDGHARGGKFVYHNLALCEKKFLTIERGERTRVNAKKEAYHNLEKIMRGRGRTKLK